ncbi:UbiX family flavin prenyltransferase [Pectinatus sottacetonis]|uniref:UbiX family flavin prenyltransferase n=1 Tax=Pectinatus sottacetonis TaxID=1002795 RepID=UPI0018C643AB|nr:UbiX family flavin prenyltransferase [Pectinatus sottacetonis]
MNKRKKRIIIGITGASGSIYAVKLLEVLQAVNIETHLVITHSGIDVLQYECQLTTNDMKNYTDYIYDVDNIGASIASGSFLCDAMVVLPCSMKTIGSIAAGITDNLLIRAADVTIKENRKLILVPRETPLSPLHLENMLKLSRIGVRIVPACPGFYHKPQKLDDLINIMVGKICDQLGIEHNLFTRWTGE